MTRLIIKTEDGLSFVFAFAQRKHVRGGGRGYILANPVQSSHEKFLQIEDASFLQRASPPPTPCLQDKIFAKSKGRTNGMNFVLKHTTMSDL